MRRTVAQYNIVVEVVLKLQERKDETFITYYCFMQHGYNYLLLPSAVTMLSAN